MPIIIQEREIQEFDLDSYALRVFLKALEILGGPRKLILYRNLTWVVSLLEASYVIVMAQKLYRTEDDIAEFLGLTRATVRNILRSDPQLVLEKLSDELKKKEIKVHVAGGLAKLAYDEIEKGHDNLEFFSHVFEEASKILGVGWPPEVLYRLKGSKWPLTKQEVLNRLKPLKIFDYSIEEIFDRIERDVFEHPRYVLKEISLVLKELEKENH